MLCEVYLPQSLLWVLVGSVAAVWDRLVWRLMFRCSLFRVLSSGRIFGLDCLFCGCLLAYLGGVLGMLCGGFMVGLV